MSFLFPLGPPPVPLGPPEKKGMGIILWVSAYFYTDLFYKSHMLVGPQQQWVSTRPALLSAQQSWVSKQVQREATDVVLRRR